MVKSLQQLEKVFWPIRVVRLKLETLPRLLGVTRLKPNSKLAILLALVISLIFILELIQHICDEHPLNAIATSTIVFLVGIVSCLAVYWLLGWILDRNRSVYVGVNHFFSAVEDWQKQYGKAPEDYRRFLVLGSNFSRSRAMHFGSNDQDVEYFPPEPEEWIHAFVQQGDLFLHLDNICHTSYYADFDDNVRSHDSRILRSKTLQIEDESAFNLNAMDETLQGSHEAEALDFAEIQRTADADEDSVEESDYGTLKGDSTITEVGSQKTVGPDGNLAKGDPPTDAMNHYCHLLNKRFSSAIPFSGVVVTIPFDVFLSERYDILVQSVVHDLTTLRSHGNIRFPVVFAFSSMERDNGFAKLQSLLGKSRLSNRFGAGCEADSPPESVEANLQIQVERTCTTFDKWIFNRWSKSVQLSRDVQNKDLFELVIRIRREFAWRLKGLLHKTFLNDSALGHPDFVLGGCYFMSTGPADERGFSLGLFSKCRELAVWAGWNDEILKKDNSYSLLASLVFLLAVMFLSIDLWLLVEWVAGLFARD